MTKDSGEPSDEPVELRQARFRLAQAEHEERMAVNNAHYCRDRLNKAKLAMENATKELAEAEGLHKTALEKVAPAHAARNTAFEGFVFWERRAKQWAEAKAKEEGKE